MRKTITTVAGAPLLALALAGCGGLGGGVAGGGEERQTAQAHQQRDDAADTASHAPAESTTLTTAQNARSTPADQNTPAEPAEQPTEAIAVMKAVDGKGQVSIHQLHRAGRVVTLNFSITNLGKEEVWIGDMLGQLSGDRSVGGVSLIDPVNAKRYRPGRTGDDVTEPGTCLCSPTDGVYIDGGKTHYFYATFAAPPPDVTEVNIEIPSVGTITDVPIS